MNASTCTRVHFSSTEWKLAKKGIEELLKKKDEISDNVYQIILDIDKNVFEKGITFGIDDESKQEEKKNFNTSTESYDVFDQVMFCFVCLLLFTD